MIIVKSFGMRLGSGCMAELYFRELLSGLDHEILVAEAVREYDAAARVRHVSCLVIALLSFRNIGLQNDLILRHAEIRRCFLRRVDKIQVIGGVLVMKENESNLHICGNLNSRFLGECRCRYGCSHHNTHSQCQKSLHLLVPPCAFAQMK